MPPLKKSFIALLHLGYWALYLLLLSVVFAMLRMQSPQKASTITVLLASRAGYMAIVPNLVAFYLSYLLLFPRLLARRRIAALVFGMIAGSVGSAAAGLLTLSIISGVNQPAFANARELISLIALLSGMALIHMTIALVMAGFINWYDDLNVKGELRRKTGEMEMALLRSRIDPHFLFNTLNNVDVLIARDPATASAYLNKLCDVMRFVLYETAAPAIPLAAELGYIGKYIDLERIRSANPRFVTFEVTGSPDGLMIAPMIFVPFIENAFKHAERHKSGAAISVHVAVESSRITFRCSNRHRGRSGEERNHAGLGNELIQRRLALIYPVSYTLEVTDHDDTYTIRLTVDLDASALHPR